MSYEYLPLGTNVEVINNSFTSGVVVGDKCVITKHRPDYEDSETYNVELLTGRAGLTQVLSRDQFKVI